MGIRETLKEIKTLKKSIRKTTLFKYNCFLFKTRKITFKKFNSNDRRSLEKEQVSKSINKESSKVSFVQKYFIPLCISAFDCLISIKTILLPLTGFNTFSRRPYT